MAVQKAGKKLIPTDPDFWTREDTSAASLYKVCFLDEEYLHRVIKCLVSDLRTVS